MLLLIGATVVYAGVNDSVTCETSCPAGTRLTNIDVVDYNQAEAESGVFLYVTESCESFCEPIVPCILPNVPVVDASGFQCQPLPGLNSLPPVEDVDLSFGTAWDESQAVVE